MSDEYLLSMAPYRPLDASSTPTSNSPSPPSSHQASQYPPDRTRPLSSRGTSLDVTSPPSELSRHISGTSSHSSAQSSPPVPGVLWSLAPQLELIGSESRPGPEDAEGSTRRWSFRSRKANQLQPYKFDRLQYKQQLRGNPDAVVTALSPHRQRPSPGSTMDQDFIANDDEENTQETGELSGLTITGEEESQSQSRDSHHPRRRISSSRDTPPGQPPPQWYLDGMKEISDTDNDGDVVEYLAGRSRKKQAAIPTNNNDYVSANQEESDDQPRRRRKRRPKPPPWFRHVAKPRSRSPDPPLPNSRNSRGRSMEGVRTPSPDFGFPSPSSLSDDHSGSIPPQPSPRRRRRASTSAEPSEPSETDQEMALSKKQLRALRRILPAGMIQKQLHQPPPPRRSRSTTAPPPPEGSPSSSKVIPWRARTRRVNRGAGSSYVIKGDSESSDERRSVISVSSSVRSISDVEELRSRTFPGVLDLPLNSSDESNVSDLEDASVDDADIGAWIHRKPVNLRPDYGDFGEAEEGDLIDRMLSRTIVSRRRTKKPTKNATLDLPVVKRGHRKRKKPTNIYVGGFRPHDCSRQLRIPDLFGTGQVNKSTHDEVDRRTLAREGKMAHNMSNRAGNTDKGHPTENSTSSRNKKRPRIQTHQHHNFPTTTRIVTGRQHIGAMNLQLEEEPEYVPRQRPYSPDNPQQDTPTYSILEPTHYRAIHPSEFRVLPPNISFGPNTYLGRGWLRDLLAELSGQDTIAPPSFFVQEVELDSTMDVEDFAKVFVSTVDRLLATLQIGTAKLMIDWNEWQNTLHPLFRLFTWMVSGGYSITEPLRNDALERASRLATDLDAELERTSTMETKAFLLTARWVSFELLLRVHSASGSVPLRTLSTALVKHIFQSAFLKPAASAFPDPTVVETLDPSQQLFQVWICLFHTLDHLVRWFREPGGDGVVSPDLHPIWQLVRSAWESEKLSDLDASEKLWSSIFNLCAISQFSLLGISSEVPRLSACWDVVLLALRRIRLVTGQTDDPQIPRRRVIKRDQYIRLLFSRCFFLRKPWLWNLKDASALFGLLSDVFKNRKFSNLNGEASDFPSFVRHDDMSLLSEYRNSDTAFGLFLKLAVLAVKDMREIADDPSLPLKLRKLMSVLVPVGSVPFTKDTPPTSQELSMLYNRLSSIAIAIYLDPNTTNTNSRIAQARRYVAFKDADLSTRRACTRGMMHFAMITCRLQLPLSPTLEWMAEATDVLLDEYRAFPPNDTRLELKNRIVLMLQLLIGSLRRILECMGKKDPKVYPDPVFMEGPWVTRVFTTMTDIANLPTTGIEIQRLVQTFLNVRAAYMPKPRRPTIHAATEDSQESQDYFGMFDIDLNDPDLQAVLGDEVESPEAKEVVRKDKLLGEVVQKTVINGIFKLVMKRVADVPEGSSRELAHFDLDKWIDCWVGCAQIVVHNGLRAWPFYLALGDKSWERITDGPWRRRIGLRFMFMLLVLDPASYTSHKNNFFDVLFESLVTSEITMEHQYVSILFSIDGLQHPLVDGLTLQGGIDGDYLVTETDFKPLCLTVIIRATRNLSERIQQEGEMPELRGNNQVYIGHLLRMLSAMEDILQFLLSSKSRKTEGYTSFRDEVVSTLGAYPELVADGRLGQAIARVSRVGGS
ncbi:hypothetical protein BDM02DRAFT_3171519 [Thelephora ganbajun]|uniref:Uncharacterized protein n=1 Tax=Thelephora ganbajun TaxID=370292 RepID=A0ACB6ZAL9_THEGA|nr:hypothetical protein BDM02DRAFT_3171519 [Thelephora ganbajun]